MIKKYRLLAKADFDNVLKNKAKTSSFQFSVFAKNNVLDHARIGISCPKSLCKAHLRVRVRRQVRSMLVGNSCFAKSVDIVIIVKQGYFEKTFHDNKNILLKQIEHIIEREANK